MKWQKINRDNSEIRLKGRDKKEKIDNSRFVISLYCSTLLWINKSITGAKLSMAIISSNITHNISPVKRQI